MTIDISTLFDYANKLGFIVSAAVAIMLAMVLTRLGRLEGLVHFLCMSCPFLHQHPDKVATRLKAHEIVPVPEAPPFVPINITPLKEANPSTENYARARFRGVKAFVDNGEVVYVNEATWRQILTQAYQGLPSYAQDRFECVDFAVCVMGFVMSHYELTIGMARGIGREGGEHAWNIVYCGAGQFLQFEPQTGEFNPPYQLQEIYME